MSLPKLLGVTGFVVFGIIFSLALFKGDKNKPSEMKVSDSKISVEARSSPIEVPLKIDVAAPAPKIEAPLPPPVKVIKESQLSKPEKLIPEANGSEVNRIEDLFKKGGSPFKFIETITYKSRVPWQKGRPAWLSDYASHYETSRHFIARSLNGKPDYFKQEISDGDKINVFKTGVKLKFHLVVDTSLSRLWLYALDDTNGETTLLKTYPVSLGRIDSSKPSGLLTPLGRFSLGSRIAIYKPKVMGYHKGKKIEMIREFGSRWIPFEKEIADATAPAKGYGLHGVPWNEKTNGVLAQDKSSLGKYESDGCIRMSTEDIEEVFAIIITKPAEIEIVKHFNDASIHKR